MNKKNLWIQMLLVCQIVLGDSGCGTWLGNPKDPDGTDKKQSMVDLDFAGVTSTNLTMTSLDVTDANGEVIGTLEIEEALIALKEVKLEPLSSNLALKSAEEESDSESSDFDFDGPYLVDLLTNTVTPDPEARELTATTYERIRLKLAKLEEDDASRVDVTESDQIFERSIYIAGFFTPNSGDTKEFTMSFDLDEEFEIRSEDGISLEPDMNATILISFALPQWFEFANEATNPDGHDFSQIEEAAIVLDDDSDGVAKELREVIKDNIKGSADSMKE